MRHTYRRRGDAGAAALVLGLILTSCGETPSGGVSAPIGAEAPLTLCSRLGFVSGTSALADCMAKLDGLVRDRSANQSRCEGIRQRALSTRFPAIGTGTTVVNADADYQSCMSGQLIAPAQVNLPTGRVATCRVTGPEIACN